MRKIFLTTASVLALCAGPALALEGGDDGGSHNNHNNGGNHQAAPTIEQYLAVAVAVNVVDLSGNSHSQANGQANSAAINASFNGATGVANQNQNAGANSSLQNALALAYVEGCECATTTPSAPAAKSVGNAATLAGALNFGSISGAGGYPSGLPYVASPAATSASTSISGGSYNGFVGVAQVNQNAGAGAALQNATALATVSPVQGTISQDKLALGLALNSGSSDGNWVTNSNHHTSASIDGSFSNMVGQVNVNQNSAANALMQNSTALSTIEYCGCAANDLSVSVALAGNFGDVTGNGFAASGGSNAAGMNNSFNNSRGDLQVSQNAGANSLLQNAATLSTITRH